MKYLQKMGGGCTHSGEVLSIGVAIVTDQCSSVLHGLGAHHTAVQLRGIRVCPLLRLAVRAAFAVQAGGGVTWARYGRIKGVGGQRAVEEVLVRAQVVTLNRGGAGQAKILVVGAHGGEPGTRGPGLLTSQ